MVEVEPGRKPPPALTNRRWRRWWSIVGMLAGLAALAWLVLLIDCGQLERLSMSAVLETVAIERFIDGVVFTGFVALVVVNAMFPDPSGNIRFGLGIAGIGTLAQFAGLLGEDVHGNRITPTFTYIADGRPTDRRPSLRYLDSIEHA